MNFYIYFDVLEHSLTASQVARYSNQLIFSVTLIVIAE